MIFAIIYVYMNMKDKVNSTESWGLMIFAATELVIELAIMYRQLGN